MTPLLPRSLSGRLILLIAGVLLLAQLLSAAVLLADRGTVLYQATGLASAQRIAGIVRLLDPMGPDERRRAVQALDVAPLRLTLAPVAWPPAGAEAGDSRGVFLSGVLGRLLEGRPLRVAVGEPALAALPPGRPGWGPGRGMGGMMYRHMTAAGLAPPGRAAFLAQVQLGDGTWVTFDHRLPEEIFTWPWKLLASLAILLGATVLTALLAVRWLTRPLTTLATAADELGRDMQRQPLPEDGPAEVVRAARAFNRMQQRLVRFIGDRSRVLAAVSHDLKTPITRLRLRTELLADEALQEKYRGDLDEMEAMVRDTLDFMRGTDTAEATRPVDINALVETLQADAEAAGATVAVRGSAAAPYPGRPLALKRCLGNLLENGRKYGGAVEVVLEEAGTDLSVSVLDRGPGIPEAELERVFDPFYRLEGSRSRSTGGSGLGLGIARNIARAHGGELTLRNRPGGGLEARLTLPRPAA